MIFGGGWGWGGTWWMGVIGLVLFALMIASVVWLIVSLSRPRHWGVPFAGPGPGPGYPPPPRSQALEELDITYARGQLSREEYFRRRADLTGWSPPGGPPGFASGSGGPSGAGGGSGSGSQPASGGGGGSTS